VDRKPQCPDCFDPENDVCALLNLERDAAD
jgi:DtxR family Mn-dependent transcriptional regulator